MNQSSSDARNVRLKSATLIRDVRREADRPFAPADRFQQRFLRATKWLRRKRTKVTRRSSHSVKPARYPKVADHLPPLKNLHCDWRLDRWVRIVTDEFEIFEREAVDVFDGWVEFHLGQWSAIA